MTQRIKKQLQRIHYKWLIGVVVCLLGACSVQSQAGEATVAQATTLTELSADPIVAVNDPKQYLDPAYHLVVKKATSASDGAGRMRHEYSRRQAFNADNSKFLAQDGSGHWFLYDAQSMTVIQSLSDLAGDCEPIWHASDSKLLYFTERGGGGTWWVLNVETGTKELVYDFSTDGVWQEAESYWTKGEGTTSADGRYITLIASTYHSDTQQTTVYGIVMLDLVERKVIARLEASEFPTAHAMPDHVSTAPSGKFAVVSWLAQDGGTVAYTSDFKTAIPLAASSEHSDLAIGANDEDILVYADYAIGSIVAIDVATGTSTPLHTLYPAEGEGYALHVSGQAFDMPGWAVVSTYADFEKYGAQSPSQMLQPEYRKVWLLELKPDGRRLNVAHIRSNWESVTGDDYYFLEPQASVSRDLTKIIFASNVDGAIESYIVELPVEVIESLK